jgi:membrane protein YqaA with SNARE-associated domain
MGLIWLVATAVWGVAEATVFFIVPDVILTYATLRFGWRAGLRLAAVAAASASLAGIGMWLWGNHNPASAQHVMLLIPAIGPDQLARTTVEMADRFWPIHLVFGAVQGVPYKLYAVAAGEHAVPPVWFVPISFLARFLRFAFSVALTALGGEVVGRFGGERSTYLMLTAGWLLLYGVYFTLRAMAG